MNIEVNLVKHVAGEQLCVCDTAADVAVRVEQEINKVELTALTESHKQPLNVFS